MSAATVEDAILNDWGASATLDDLVPEARTFIGLVPLLDEYDLEEITPPLVSVREEQVVSTTRTNEGTLLIDALVAIEVQNESRERAKAISDAIKERFNRRDLTWDKGTVADMRPQSRRETQGEDGMWFVTWLFMVRYTQTS